MTNEEEKLRRQRDGELIEQGRREMWDKMNTWCKVFTCGEVPNTKTTMWCDRYNDVTRACTYSTCPLRSKT